jgi:hypothetical protein
MKYYGLFLDIKKEELHERDQHRVGRPIAVMGQEDNLPPMTLAEFLSRSEPSIAASVKGATAQLGYHISEVVVTEIGAPTESGKRPPPPGG